MKLFRPVYLPNHNLNPAFHTQLACGQVCFITYKWENKT